MVKYILPLFWSFSHVVKSHVGHDFDLWKLTNSTPFQVQTTRLWQSAWERRSSKRQWGKSREPKQSGRNSASCEFSSFRGKFMKTLFCLGALLAIMPMTISGAYLARATQQRSHLPSSTETFWGCVVTNSHYQMIFSNSKCSRSTSFSASWVYPSASSMCTSDQDQSKILISTQTNNYFLQTSTGYIT